MDSRRLTIGEILSYSSRVLWVSCCLSCLPLRDPVARRGICRSLASWNNEKSKSDNGRGTACSFPRALAKCLFCIVDTDVLVLFDALGKVPPFQFMLANLVVGLGVQSW